MKVLHLISGGDKGGAKTHVFTLLEALQEDISIRVICFMEGVFYQEIKTMDIPSMLIKQRYRNDLTIISKLVAHIRSEQYDLIHAHGARANFIAVLLRPFIKIPMLTTVHSDYRLDFTDSLYKKMVFTELNAAALRLMDYYIAVSEQFKEMLAQRRFDPERIFTVYNSIDFEKDVEVTPKEQFLAQHNIDAKGKTLVGIIGRFDKVKGHDVFMKAAAQVLKTRQDVLFLLAGEGPEQQHLEHLAKQHGIQNHVKFLGFVNDIYSFVNAIDMNVLSSHSESFPYVLLEGAKMCKATVTTAVGGIPDLIKDGETGLLSPPANPEVLAEKICLLLEDKGLAKAMGERLNTFARTHFSKESMKQRHIEIYNNVLKRHTAAGKRFDVMLSGYYGFRNSGDDALLKAIIDSLRQEKPDLAIAVLSKDPKETQARHGVFAINRSNMLAIRRYMKRTRVFINGGGSLIQDITSTQSLLYYTTLMHFAKGFGLKVMLYANGIGPILKWYNQKIAKNALAVCDVITLRESASFEAMEKLGISSRKASLTCDPTFAIRPAPEAELQAVLAKEGIDPNKSYLAISVRQWKYSDSNFVAKMTEAIDSICMKHGLIPLFIPMQQPYDVIISKEMMHKLSVEALILTGDYPVEMLMGIIGQTKLVMAMRLHTLIYAVNMGVPVVGIVYDPKIQSFMNQVGQETYVSCHHIDTARLTDMVDGVLNDLPHTKNSIENRSAQLKALSNRDAQMAIDLIH